ncbi:MAG: hypothetical protein IJX49_05095, partial [Clostridia bacterium]|nr:hypothetical protein [Clostridia bacterium]
MKKSKKLLTLLMASAFIGASAGAVAVTLNNVNGNDAVVASAETEATVLDGTFTPSFNAGAYASDGNYDHTSIYLTSSVAFKTDGGAYLNDHADTFGIDLMDYIYVNGKSARTIFNERGGDDGAFEKYPGSTLEIKGSWAPITVEVLPYNGTTAIRVDVDKRYIPTASLEVTLKACEFTYGGTTYKLSADETYKMTLGAIENTAAWGNLTIKKASEVTETAIKNPFTRAAKWSDEGNYYKYMVQGPATDIKMNSAHGNGKFLQDNLCYFHDYMLVNGRSISEIELEDYSADFNFSGSPIEGSRNYDFCVMPQVYVNETDNYLCFNINKDWAEAKGITLNTLQLTLKAGMPYYGSDGVVYRTTTDFNVPNTTVTGGSFDASVINYSVTETGIGTYEIGTSGLDMQTINCGWHLTQLDTVGGLNEGAESKILLNGKSVAEWNATDDSAWTYTDIGWPNDFHSGFYKPVVLNFTADKMQVYIHPNLMSEFGNYVSVEIPEAFTIINAEMTCRFEIPALEETRLWAKDVTVTVRLGGNPMDTSSVYTVNAKYGDTITLEEPTAEGKTFAGW